MRGSACGPTSGGRRHHWGLQPEDKVSIVKELGEAGFTVMVGDGINDAKALATADVGISIGQTKADLAIKSSDIIILRNDATSLLTVVQMGKKLIRVIKQNYAWAIGFNVAGIALATGEFLPPGWRHYSTISAPYWLYSTPHAWPEVKPPAANSSIPVRAGIKKPVSCPIHNNYDTTARQGPTPLSYREMR
ncbi:MAG: HAD-IC family P-type ATPase [Candidatus Syntrophopropionicum ammoniitolerans]